MKYALRRLDEVGVSVLDCDHSTPKSAPTGNPYIAIPNIRNGHLDLKDVRLISRMDFEFSTRRTRPLPGDIVVTRRARVGDTAVIPEGLECALGQNLVLLRSDGTQIDQRYLRWAVRSPQYWTQVSKYQNEGAVFSSLNVSDFPKFEIPVPPLSTQRRIADILGTLDDKIECNRRINKTLEGMVQALFKYWFVDFGQFRNGEFVDSELGIIPKGWKVGRIAEVVKDITSGSRPKGGVGEVSEGVPSIGAENILGLGKYDHSKTKYVPREFFDEMKSGVVKNGDVLLYKDGAQLGRKSYFDYGFPFEVCCVNEHVFILRVNDFVTPRYLYFWLDQSWMTERIVNLNSNSAQPGINRTAVYSLPILMPPPDVIQKWDEIVEPLLANLFANCKENRIVARTRDYLLPRLMSGQIEIKTAEEQIAEMI